MAQCGYCRPGQIMAAVAKVRQARAAGHEIGDADLDEIRDICRCGTYHRIREAIRAGAARMCRPAAAPRRPYVTPRRPRARAPAVVRLAPRRP